MSEQSRLTVKVQAYHQAPGEPPLAVVGNYARRLVSPERPYARRLLVDQEWKNLDAGWCADGEVSLLSLENREGRGLQTVPTAAEAAATAAKVVEVGLAVGSGAVAFALVRPGETLAFPPADVPRLRLRCGGGPAVCHLTVFPA